MSILFPIERALLNLEESIDQGYLFAYMNKEAAASLLREETGQDFGFDARLWRKWLEENGLVNETRP